MADVIGAWAALALAEGDPTAAARILGLSVAVRGLPMPPLGDAGRPGRQRCAASSATPAYDAAYDEGPAWTARRRSRP